MHYQKSNVKSLDLISQNTQKTQNTHNHNKNSPIYQEILSLFSKW